MMMTRRTLVAGLCAAPLAGIARGAQADALPPISGKVILTVSGKIGVTNGEGIARFDRAALESLDTARFTTTTPWYTGPVTFEGIRMSRLMEVLQASGTTVVATALNDYETSIPLDDFSQFNVIMALKRDGEYLPVKDKGPLFIVYPFDSASVLKTQKYYSRSAWQLSRLSIV